MNTTTGKECFLQGYGVVTAAGSGVKPFLAALVEGRVLARPVSCDPWPDHLPRPAGGLLAALFSERERAWPLPASAADLLTDKLVESFAEASHSQTLSGSTGVIFASTKGAVEDSIYSDAPVSDPLSPVLDGFIKRISLKTTRTVCVSQACASSLAALHLGRQWLRAGLVENVVVAAADLAGPFILGGFAQLGATSSDGCRPFSFDRNGLVAGDGAAVVILTGDLRKSRTRLAATSLCQEGHAVTRPDPSGLGLAHAIRGACQSSGQPDVVIAHGTGTETNDEAEFRAIGGTLTTPVFVTGTKWCVGHTFGTSGLLDVVAASEILASGEPFRLATTIHPDRRFREKFLFDKPRATSLRRVLVNSLGFGGINATAVVETVE